MSSGGTNEHGDLEGLPSRSPRFTFADFLQMLIMLIENYNGESRSLGLI